MKILIPSLLLFMLAGATSWGQTTLPRLFLDLPSFLVAAPNTEKIKERIGIDLGTAMNVATHWGTARLGGGALFSLNPTSNDVGASFLTSPYGFAEVGLGQYRTNGNKCAKTKANAFTAVAKGGVRYGFDTEKSEVKTMPTGWDFTVGIELGYFYIRDVFKNSEFVFSGNYLTRAKVYSVGLGFKTFLNLRAER